MSVRVQDAAFSVGEELERFTAQQAGAGAVVSFTGIVRDESGRLSAMEIEHYPGMTQSALEKIAHEAESRWPLTGRLIIHRYGGLSRARRS